MVSVALCASVWFLSLSLYGFCLYPCISVTPCMTLNVFLSVSQVRFMLETMLALKNNDMRKIPGYDPEPVERFRKLQRTLVRCSAH